MGEGGWEHKKEETRIKREAGEGEGGGGGGVGWRRKYDNDLSSFHFLGEKSCT